MTYDPQKHNRRSIRLKGYDYTQPGVYFVTVVTQQRECSLGEIFKNEMVVNPAGKIVLEAWGWLASQYAYVTLDEFCVMPNHFHGVIMIDDTGFRRGGSLTAPTKTKPLGRLIGAFKTVSTKWINEMRGTPGATVWQRNYYEHIVRDGRELGRIRAYIATNPARWHKDTENR